jgi:hypothetical protein
MMLDAVAGKLPDLTVPEKVNIIVMVGQESVPNWKSVCALSRDANCYDWNHG